MLQHPQRVGPDLHILCCSKPTLTNIDTARNRCACHQLGNTAPLLFAASPPFASGSPPTLASSAATAQVAAMACCKAQSVCRLLFTISGHQSGDGLPALLGIQWGGLQPELLRRQPSRLMRSTASPKDSDKLLKLLLRGCSIWLCDCCCSCEGRLRQLHTKSAAALLRCCC
jgi:hypothetical protein